MLSLILVAFVILIVKWSWDRIQFFKLRDKMGIPGPPTQFPLGNVNYILNDMKKNGKEDSINMRFRMAKQYGDVVGMYLGQHFEVTTTDLDIINEVFIKQFSKFVNRPTQHFGGGYPMNENILQMTREGPGKGYGWKDIRSVISPIFTTGKLKAMFPIMEERVNAFVEHLKGMTSSEENDIEMYNELQALSLDVIGRCAFGMETECIKDKTDKFYINAQKFFNSINLEESVGMLVGFFSPKIGQFIRPWTREGKTEKVLLDGLKEVVERRKRTFGSDSDNRKDLISLMLEQDRERQRSQKKPPLSDETIVSNCYAFLLAGYETTSTALSFGLYALAKNPEVQQTLYDELTDNFNFHTDITYDALMKLPYLEAVMMESLRRYPPVVFFTTRECVEDCEIKGIKFKKGVCVQCPVHLTHYNPEYWPDPLKFDPNRFLAINNHVDNLTWMPFGIGPRNCVGMRFAELEYKSALAALVLNFKFELGKELQDKELACGIMAVLYRPLDGVNLKVTAR
ncbi:unnamed protein product [Bursaphelenchus okinawaensis]|uniref:Cytochrome P450 n=1 Tax=Bursaphelenchus okinawaensis TaxID=465554 RepID=A0A811LDP9_9BILA|nr:unnamed protein product [Bursaphelenchus okinawaensis]CAG9120526.1 unnamed protein product [Bursaphelenchus okinawaensis]